MAMSTDINIKECYPCNGAETYFFNFDTSVQNNGGGIASSGTFWQSLDFVQDGYIKNNWNDFMDPNQS